MNKLEINLNSLNDIRLPCTIDMKIPVKTRFSIDTKSILKERTFLLDTGADYTCISAKDLGIKISEKEFSNWCKSNGKTAYGVSEDIELKLYKVQMNNINIYGMDLGSFPIYVIFNENITSALLGMDIIRALNITMSSDECKLKIEKSTRLLNYQKTNLRVTNIKDLYPELKTTDKQKPNLFNALSLANPNNK